MNYIDIILGLLLVVAAIRGFVKGFIFEVASLAALILGIWGGIHFSCYLAGFIGDTFSWHPDYLGLLCFFIILVVVVVVVHLAGMALSKLADAVALGFLNHVAGLFFGIVKSAFILSILLLLFDQFDRHRHIIPEEHKVQSQVYEPLKNFAPSIFPFLNFSKEDFPNKGNGKKDKQIVT